MLCFARVSGVIVKCSVNADCGKSEQDLASYYYLLVVERGWVTTKDYWPNNIFSNSSIIPRYSFTTS